MNIGETLNFGSSTLKRSGIDTYLLDSKLLFSKVSGLDKLYIMTHREEDVAPLLVEEYKKIIKKRSERVPLQYLTGHCEFMGLQFTVKEEVLIPRPDTEILVYEALKIVKDKNIKSLCDVCCGSGIIGISIGYNTKAKVTCYDISDKAIGLTGENIIKHSLEERVNVLKSDLLNRAIESNIKFQMVVSNPPYIPKDKIEDLMDEVSKYEPRLALDGGNDGLDFYRRLARESKAVLCKGGYILFEIGCEQKQDLFSILNSEGYKEIECIKDFASLDRVIKAVYY